MSRSSNSFVLNSFVVLLTMLFIGMKLMGVITWSWLWVLSPLWLLALFAIAVLLLIITIFALIGMAGDRIRANRLV